MTEGSESVPVPEAVAEPESRERIVIALTPCLVNAETLGKMLGVSKRTIYRMDASGELGPMPVKLGGRRLWRTQEISRWVMADCPRRMKWLDSRRGRQARGESGVLRIDPPVNLPEQFHVK